MATADSFVSPQEGDLRQAANHQTTDTTAILLNDIRQELSGPSQSESGANGVFGSPIDRNPATRPAGIYPVPGRRDVEVDYPTRW